MIRRLAIILAALLLSMLPTPATAPAQTIATQALLTIVTTPRSDGTIVEMSVPADLWPELTGSAPIIDRPNVERWMRP